LGLAQVGVLHPHIGHEAAARAAHALVVDFGGPQLVQLVAIGIVHGPAQVAERPQGVVAHHLAAQVVARGVEHRHYPVHGVHQPPGRFYGHYFIINP